LQTVPISRNTDIKTLLFADNQATVDSDDAVQICKHKLETI